MTWEYWNSQKRMVKGKDKVRMLIDCREQKEGDRNNEIDRGTDRTNRKEELKVCIDKYISRKKNVR